MNHIAEIKARLAAATPGPWTTTNFRNDCHIRVYSPLRNMHSIAIMSQTVPNKRKEDADLIANAPADIAFLLAEVERLKNHVSALENLLDTAALNEDQDWRHKWSEELAGFYKPESQEESDD